MISGYNTNINRETSSTSAKHINGGFPVPFNIPIVLHNLLFSDIDLNLTPQQKDILETLRFSYKSLQKVLQQYARQEQELRQKMLQKSDDATIKAEYEALELERMDAIHDFQDLLEVMAEMLTKEQYEKLLKFSNLPT